MQTVYAKRFSNPVDLFSVYHAIADFTGLLYVSGFLSGLKSHGLISHDYLSQST